MTSRTLVASSAASLSVLLLAVTNGISIVGAAILPQDFTSPNMTATVPYVVPTVTAAPLALPSGAFGSAIEGAAVNADGDLFAADFRAGNLTSSTSYGYFFESQVGTADVLDLSRNPIFNAAADLINDTAENPPLLAGGRFLRDGSLLLTGKYASASLVTCFFNVMLLMQPNARRCE